MPHNFDTANGDKWVHVDLTNQTATAYQGTTVVKKFNIASGKPTADGSMLSDTGHVLRVSQVRIADHGWRRLQPARHAVGFLL